MKKSLQIITTAVLLACSGSLLAATVVTVNGVKIDSKDVERRTQNVLSNTQGQVADSPQLRQQITNQLITEQLLVQEAKRLKIDQSEYYKAQEADAMRQIKEKKLDKQPNFKQDWADFQNNLLIMAYDAHISQQHPITETEVRQKYNQLKSLYDKTSEVQLSEIVTLQPADADAAIKELNNRQNFADVAKKYSVNEATKNAGGMIPNYLSLVDLKNSKPAIHSAINQLNKGQYTKTPIKDGNIMLILYVHDKRTINMPAFDAFKNHLMSEMEEQQRMEMIDELGKKAKIIPAK